MFNINNNQYFIIDNFKYNEPIKIKYYNIFNNKDILNNTYLNIDKNKNYVFFDKNNLSNWIIEKFENDNSFYIKNEYKQEYGTQYLGAPNKNNNVFTYTSKNIFTKWNIKQFINNIYYIDYIGSKFNKDDVNLIIARYHENIDWVLAYNDIAIIYNKGNNDIPQFNNIKNINNIGREGHTYLYHMKNEYNNLSNYNIFIQGNPFDHNETILYGIDNYFNFLDIQPLGKQYFIKDNLPPQSTIDKYQTITDYNLKYMIVKIDGNMRSTYFYDKGVDHLNNEAVHDYKDDLKKYTLFELFLTHSNFPYKNDLNNVYFTLCALFAVHKKYILKYNIEVYDNLINQLLRFHPQGGRLGYILERLWLYIFENAKNM